jgi:hypothetical protein
VSSVLDHPFDRRRALREAAAVGLLYLAIATVVLWPLIRHLESTVLYGATDSVGTLRDYWAAQAQSKNPFTLSHDRLDGAPEGYPRSTAIAIANVLQPALILSAKGAIGLVGAWNVLTVAGFVLTAFAMFGVLRILGFRLPTAVIGGYVLGFGPWMYNRAYVGHAGMQQLWVLPMLVIACVFARRRRSLAWAAMIGALGSLAMYLHSYIGLMAGVVVVTFYALELILTPDRTRTLLLGSVTFITLAALFAPPLWLYARNPGGVAARVSQPISDLYNGGATLEDYLLPSSRNPVIGWLRPHRLEGEHVLFFGYVTMVLAAVGAAIALRGRRSFADDERAWLALFALAVGAVALYTSFKPVMHVGPLGFPTPSDAVVRVVAYWRAYVRVGTDVGIALVILSSFAYDRLLSRPRGGAIMAGLAALLIVELGVRLPVPTWRTNDVSAHVRWLAAHPGGIVANYPLPIERGDLDLGARENWYQTYHGHPLFALWGGNQGGTREEAIRIAASNLSDPTVANILATEHVRFVVVHDAVYRSLGATPPTLTTPSYRLVARLPDDTRIYTIHAARVDLGRLLIDQSERIALARAYPAPDASYGGGFNPPETFTDGRPWRWMTQNGDLDVRSVEPGRYLLVLDAFSNGEPRTLSLLDAAGHVLGSKTVTAERQTLTYGPVKLDGATTLNLHVDPGPRQLSATDPRQASVFLSPFELRPAPDFYGRLNG